MTSKPSCTNCPPSLSRRDGADLQGFPPFGGIISCKSSHFFATLPLIVECCSPFSLQMSTLHSIWAVRCHPRRPNAESNNRVAIALGFHLFPSRTEKLSPGTPMVLHEKCGRVGRRLFLVHEPSQSMSFVKALFLCLYAGSHVG